MILTLYRIGCDHFDCNATHDVATVNPQEAIAQAQRLGWTRCIKPIDAFGRPLDSCPTHAVNLLVGTPMDAVKSLDYNALLELAKGGAIVLCLNVDDPDRYVATLLEAGAERHIDVHPEHCDAQRRHGAVLVGDLFVTVGGPAPALSLATPSLGAER